MAMLIKCCWLLMAAVVVLLLIDRVAILPAVECISNGGAAGAGRHADDGDDDGRAAAAAAATEPALAAGDASGPLGRQAKALRFFPTDQSNRIDANQYVVQSSYEAADTDGGSLTDNAFKFSNEMRPSYSPANAAKQSFDSGSLIYYQGQQQQQQQHQQQHHVVPQHQRPVDQSNDIYYGNAASAFNAPRPPTPANHYAQNYNYAGQPHVQQIYTRPPAAARPPPAANRPPPPNYAQYQSTGAAGHRPSPYRPPSHGPPATGNVGQRPQYAGNYNTYQSAQTPDGSISLLGLLSNFGQTASDLISGNRQQAQPQYPQYASNGQPAAANPLNRFGKAIEEITRHDDLQCIPKIICQMVGAQRRQNVQGSLLASPVFSSLISAVPSTSSGLVYGRAALLGYTAGEDRCAGAYPQCPRNEDNLLYYLNNHRGGFFRFFNGGSAFGDLGGLAQQALAGATGQTYNPQHSQQTVTGSAGQTYNQQQSQYAQQYPLYSHQNYQQQQQQQPQQNYQQQQESTNSNLAFLTGLADAVNQSGGINLSNLGANAGILGNLASFVGSMAGLGGGGTGGGGVGDIFGNLLTGFVGDRFSSRRISKRSVSDEDAPMMNETRADLDPLMSLEKESKFVKETASKKRNLNTEMKTVAEAEESREEEEETISVDDEDEEEEEEEEILAEDENEENEENEADTAAEGRIINDSQNLVGQPEGRILNRRPQPSRYQLHLNMVNFPSQNDQRFEKKIKFTDQYHPNSVSPPQRDVFVFKTNYVETQPPSAGVNFRFPGSSYTDNRVSKKVKFDQTVEQQQFQRPLDYGQSDRRIKMVFPDRTGTGNLKFDSAEFEKDAPHASPPVRFGRILSGLGQQSHQMYRPYPEDNTNSDYNQNNYQSNYQNNQNSNSNQNYQTSSPANYNQNENYVTSRPTYNRYEPYEDYTRFPPLKRVGSSNYGNDRNRDNFESSTHRTSAASSSQNVYVTNGKGVVEYYINPAGNKVYV